jgi:endonuclease YncB( thermonuclease family)
MGSGRTDECGNRRPIVSPKGVFGRDRNEHGPRGFDLPPAARQSQLSGDSRLVRGPHEGQNGSERFGFEMVRTPRLAVIVALLLIAAAPGEEARVRYVADGDTCRLTSGERIRIAGIDAPETHPNQARRRAEMVLGEAAAARARAMFDGRDVTIVRVGRSYTAPSPG